MLQFKSNRQQLTRNLNIMDDVRIEWMKNKVYLGLGIEDPLIFDDLLTRDDGQNEDEINGFLNATPNENTSSLIFYTLTRVEEIEVEVEIGMQV